VSIDMKRMRCYYIPFLNSSTVLKLAHASAQSFSRTSRNSYSDVLTKIMHARRLRVMDGTLPFPTPTSERHRIATCHLHRSALSADMLSQRVRPTTSLHFGPGRRQKPNQVMKI
jgi:hypothetical protein